MPIKKTANKKIPDLALPKWGRILRFLIALKGRPEKT
jgi:hypothetical protein